MVETTTGPEEIIFNGELTINVVNAVIINVVLLLQTRKATSIVSIGFLAQESASKS